MGRWMESVYMCGYICERIREKCLYECRFVCVKGRRKQGVWGKIGREVYMFLWCVCVCVFLYVHSYKEMCPVQWWFHLAPLLCHLQLLTCRSRDTNGSVAEI